MKLYKLSCRLFALFCVLFLAACGDPLPPIAGCEPVGDMEVFCDMKTPEDIAALPDGRHLLLAHFGHMGESTGSISLFDTTTETRQTLFPESAMAERDNSRQALWGEASCSEPPNMSFSPHGSHLHQLDNGQWRYLVVNHGDREAVELFELDTSGATPALSWRGCVVATEDTMMNDVVGLNNGDLIYSRMFQASDSLAMLKSVIGINTGELWHWSRQQGLKPLASTAAAQPNGLEISADNRYVFANMYMEQQVWKVDLSNGEVVATADIANADNSNWGSDGRLWLVTHQAEMVDIVSCFEDQALPCPARFVIYAMDPETMAFESIFEHQGAPMGAATIAVPQAGRVYMGSFAGDRMISVPDFGVDENRG